VARRFGFAESTVRTIDLRYLERWATSRRKPALPQMGVDEIQIGKKQKFLTVVCNLETGEAAVVRTGTQEGNPGLIFPGRVEQPPAAWDRGCVCGYVRANPVEPGGVASPVSDRV
jgi:hypothetical protein